MVEFGSDFRAKYFSQVPKDIVPVNHGAFGLTPSLVQDYLNKVTNSQEKYPDEFYLIESKKIYIEQLKALGEFLNVDYHNLALLVNGSTAINCVLRSIPWDFENDKVLFTSVTYGACAKSVKFLHEAHGLQYDIVDLQYPIEDKDVIAKVESYLSQGNYRLCMFDLVASMPAVKLPYEELIKLCKKYNTWSLIDGGHGVGLVDMNFIQDLEPDFLTSNLYKWLSVPKSCAFLYVNPKHHKLIQTFPISWSYDLNAKENSQVENPNLLIDKFWYFGTVNYGARLCIKKALEFRQECCGGEEKIREYRTNLQKQAIDLVLKEFGPDAKLLQNSTNSLEIPGMFNVSFPKTAKYADLIEHLADSYFAYRTFKGKCEPLMVTETKKFAPFVAHNKELWVRFSVTLYNVASDYAVAAKSVKETIQKCLDEELEVNATY
ncbi:hypothetical protein MOUN0_I01068 [Monosporozyma unispora]|nr:hypothetical protein C6P44_002137 [Kazachstania unispora]